MLSKWFEVQGRFCADHSLEVIVAVFTVTACLLNMKFGKEQLREEGLPVDTYCVHGTCVLDDTHAADVIVMTIIRCLAILYSYHQLRNLQRLGSKYILGTAGLFTVFSSAVFTTSVMNLLQSDVADLKDALFIFLLLIDLQKASVLAQMALSSRSQEEVRTNIARGMSILGPTITLDTLVKTLLIGLGSLSGVGRVETLCKYACLGALVNYAVFMTFYPSCISLILELSRGNNAMGTLTADEIFMMHSFNEEHQKPNPVVERVKMIMIGGLFVVHVNSRWPFRNNANENTVHGAVPTMSSRIATNLHNETQSSSDIKDYFMNWLSVNVDNIVILILLLALAIKHIFLEDKRDITEQLSFNEDIRRKTDMPDPVVENTKVEAMNNSLRQRFSMTLPTIHSAVFPLSAIDGDRIEIDNESQMEFLHKEVQTDIKTIHSTVIDNKDSSKELKAPRNITQCLEIYRSELGASVLTDEEVIQLVKERYIPAHQLEKAVGDMERGVGIRRLMLQTDGRLEDLGDLPYRNYDYSKVLGSCCENVIGYIPVPVGVAGPLRIDGEIFYVPLATTEGCLVASTNRGSRALFKCGITSRVVADGMTRGPVMRLPTIERASEVMSWMQEPENFEKMKASFDQTSRFARLTKIHVRIAGKHLYVRFVAKTGDAMGMNMLSKGTEKSLQIVQTQFPDLKILSLSGNFCTDKKPAAVNWIEGRGKSVVCGAVVPADIVRSVLKTTVHALIDVNNSKNMIGSAVAGSVGGFNAHAANIVTAIYIATGQDPAQNVVSSNCMTLMEPCGPDGEDLYVSCTMPSIEVGTVGGGTGLPAQGACLDMLGVKGANITQPGENARRLARIVCATVLAGELSLLAALTAGHLVKSHLRHNRSSTAVSSTVTVSHNEGSKLTVPNTLPGLQNICTDFEQRMS